MKKCPYCGAVIEENARFCLYCMRELENKAVFEKAPSFITKYKSMILSICVTALVTALVTAAFLVIPRLVPSKQAPPSDRDTDTEQAQTTPAVDSDTKDFDADFEDGGEEADTDDTPSGGEVYTWEDEGSVTYIYRDAQSYDLISASDTASTGLPVENAVVIMGIRTAAADGVYEIPEEINGKKVVAVMSGAFSDNVICSTVKKVYFPSGIHSVWETFEHNDNLTDVYFAGDSVVLDIYAFSMITNTAQLTVHAATDTVCYYGSTGMCTIKERAAELGIGFQSLNKEDGDVDDTSDASSDSEGFHIPEGYGSQVTYTYRDAKTLDLLVNLSDPRRSNFSELVENAVIITGVEKPAQDGVYIIPEQIDGKTVVAVDDHAFSSYSICSDVKVVMIPAGVHTLSERFNYCNNLTDLYFCGKSIVIDGYGGPSMPNKEQLTIHAAPDAVCYNNIQLITPIKERAEKYGITFEEWDGKFEN